MGGSLAEPTVAMTVAEKAASSVVRSAEKRVEHSADWKVD
jgi:hypothetical protein